MRNLLFLNVVIALLFQLAGCNREPDLVDPPSAPAPERMTVLQDNVGGTEIVLVGNARMDLLVSYHRQLTDGTILDFSSTTEGLPEVLVDNEGNHWDVFGKAIAGPRTGERLQPTQSMMSYWFVAGATFPGLEIYGQGGTSPQLQLAEDPEWDIPIDGLAAGSSWDAIPSIDDPSFIQFDQRDFLDGFFLSEADRVIGTEVNGAVRAYPHLILNHHEIVNDELGGENICVAWCPLAGTSTVWTGQADGVASEFGVSGLLYNNNLMLYDRETGSVWSQVLGFAARGTLRGEAAQHLPMVETSWSTWKKIASEPEILSPETGINYDYSTNDWEWYIATNDQIFYPVDYRDDRLPLKERIHLVQAGGLARAYRFDLF